MQIAWFCCFKTMHAQSPLIGDQRAFEARQEPEDECQRENGPDDHVNANIECIIMLFDEEHERTNNMGDDENGEIGRRIVCAMMVQFFAAIRAAIAHLQEAIKHLTFTTGRAAHTKAGLERSFPITGGGV